MHATYDTEQIAAAKRLIADAPREPERLVSGALDRIAKATKLKRSTVRAIASGVRHIDVPPAPADAVVGMIDWSAADA